MTEPTGQGNLEDLNAFITHALDLCHNEDTALCEVDGDKLRCIDAIRSGVLPSSLQLLSLSDLAEEAHNALDRCQTEINESLLDQNRCSALEMRRYRLSEYRDLVLSIKSPVRKLPVEILMHIFELACCSHAGLNSLRRGLGHRNRLPMVPVTLVLTQVCSRWRNLVVSMPVLWSCFEFDCNQLDRRRSPPSPLFLFLEHSSTHTALDLTLHVGDVDRLESRESESFFSIQNCARWHSLILDGPAIIDDVSSNETETHRWLGSARNEQAIYAPLFEEVLPMLFASQRKFPELRQLQISSSENSPAIGFREEWHHPRFFVTCPKLRSLVVRNIDIALRFTQPCDGVEYIALQGVSSACAALILGNCLNVQDIILNVTRAESSEWEPHTFHRARMLEIRSLKNRMGPMLDSFTMPELTDLRFISPTHTEAPSTFTASLGSFLSRSQAFLTHLTLHSIGFEILGEVMQLLHLLPTLTYLDYKPDSREGEYTLKPLLECLTPPLLRTIFNHATREAFPNIILDDGGDEHYRHELLLPNLKELVLTLWVETVPLLVDFLRLRKSSGAPQKLQVHPHIRQRWNQARLSNKMRLSTAFQEFQGDDSLEVFVHTA